MATNVRHDRANTVQRHCDEISPGSYIWTYEERRKFNYISCYKGNRNWTQMTIFGNIYAFDEKCPSRERQLIENRT